MSCEGTLQQNALISYNTIVIFLLIYNLSCNILLLLFWTKFSLLDQFRIRKMKTFSLLSLFLFKYSPLFMCIWDSDLIAVQITFNIFCKASILSINPPNLVFLTVFIPPLLLKNSFDGYRNPSSSFSILC